VADKSKKVETYCIQAQLKLMVSIEVSAHDLDEALAMSKDKDVQDFVEIQGDYIDGSHRVTGVYLASWD
jgi:hypothetical protein